MLKHLAILCLFIALADQSNAQVNLVPNGSFEECYVCDKSMLWGGQIFIDSIHVIPYIKDWFSPKATPDRFSSTVEITNGSLLVCEVITHGDSACKPPNTGWGFQYPRTDSSFIGLITFGGDEAHYLPPTDNNRYREWLGVKLKDTLKANVCYEFTMYVARAERSNRIVSSIGAFFSSDSLVENMFFEPQTTPVPFDSSLVQIQHNPWETIYETDWTPITGIFRATGNERYLYIGNFLIDSQYPIVDLDTLQDVNYCYDSYFFIDDVSLYEYKEPCNLPLTIEESKKSTIPIYPNPTAENVTIALPSNTNKAELLIYTMQGQLLSQTQLTGTQTINTSNLANGFYLFVIQSNGSIVGREKVIITH